MRKEREGQDQDCSGFFRDWVPRWAACGISERWDGVNGVGALGTT